jgi:hypothetical protein
LLIAVNGLLKYSGSKISVTPLNIGCIEFGLNEPDK